MLGFVDKFVFPRQSPARLAVSGAVEKVCRLRGLCRGSGSTEKVLLRSLIKLLKGV